MYLECFYFYQNHFLNEYARVIYFLDIEELMFLIKKKIVNVVSGAMISEQIISFWEL